MFLLIALVFQRHPFIAPLFTYYVFSAAVSAMPDPNGGKGYKWLYSFLHGLSADFSSYFKSKGAPGT